MSTKPLVERIAARFGFVRPTQPVRELVVFRDCIAANIAGFRGAVHPQHPHMQAWWPGQGVKGLCGRPVQRVTIAENMRYHETREGRLFDILRKRQMVFGDQAMWIEV